jgi:phosphate starvation-inducible protein PhoH
MLEENLTRSQRKKNKKKKIVIGNAQQTRNNGRMNIKDIQPMTDNQERFMDAFEEKDVVVIHGYPGTGKSFLSIYMALTELDVDPEKYNKVLILRSAVASRNIGFLPGNTKEKMAEYEAPYIKIVNDLYGRGDAWGVLRQKNIIEFNSTSFLRGLTFDNTIIILDEFQNMSFQELDTVVTRFGDNCKMVIIGDTGQDDLTSERYKEESGALKMIELLSRIDDVSVIKMNEEDIVRSGFVRKYIMSRYNL